MYTFSIPLIKFFLREQIKEEKIISEKFSNFHLIKRKLILARNVQIASNNPCTLLVCQERSNFRGVTSEREPGEKEKKEF
jgi:hypothetical protein